jgi:hypothetical protein
MIAFAFNLIIDHRHQAVTLVLFVKKLLVMDSISAPELCTDKFHKLLSV